MNTRKNKPINKVLLHLAIWLIYIAYDASSHIINASLASIVFIVLLPFIINIGLFYCCTEYLFPVFYDRKKIIRFVLLILLVTIVYLVIMLFVDLGLAKFDNRPDRIKLADISWFYIYAVMTRANWFMILAAVYWRAKKLIATEKKSNELLENYYIHELQEEELKQGIVTAELAYIRAQINPHFLFNTLNFLYSNVYPLSKDIAGSILILSDMMRFVMENNEDAKPIDLSLEIKHIENYIELSQVRLNNSLYIDFEYIGSSNNKRIIPFILMTLVENAFKHGDLTDVKSPLKIRLNMLGENISFYISNKVSTIKRNEQHGIGMSNLKKCLELFYDNMFTLTIQNDGQYYSCTLDIELNVVSANVFQLN